jgi:hypothetical protein
MLSFTAKFISVSDEEMKRSYIAQLSYFLLKVYFLYNKFYAFSCKYLLWENEILREFSCKNVTQLKRSKKASRRYSLMSRLFTQFVRFFYSISAKIVNLYTKTNSILNFSLCRLWTSLIPKKHTWWWFISCPSVVSPLLVRPHLLRVHFFLRSQMAKQTHI